MRSNSLKDVVNDLEDKGNFILARNIEKTLIKSKDESPIAKKARIKVSKSLQKGFLNLLKGLPDLSDDEARDLIENKKIYEELRGHIVVLCEALGLEESDVLSR